MGQKGGGIAHGSLWGKGPQREKEFHESNPLLTVVTWSTLGTYMRPKRPLCIKEKFTVVQDRAIVKTITNTRFQSGNSMNSSRKTKEVTHRREVRVMSRIQVRGKRPLQKKQCSQSNELGRCGIPAAPEVISFSVRVVRGAGKEFTSDAAERRRAGMKREEDDSEWLSKFQG